MSHDSRIWSEIRRKWLRNYIPVRGGAGAVDDAAVGDLVGAAAEGGVGPGEDAELVGGLEVMLRDRGKIADRAGSEREKGRGGENEVVGQGKKFVEETYRPACRRHVWPYSAIGVFDGPYVH